MNIKNRRIKKGIGFTLALLVLVYLLPVNFVSAKEVVAKVYVNGVSGQDSKDGSSNENALASYEKAAELAREQKAIIVVSGTLTVTKDTTWKQKIHRSEEFQGILVEVKDGVTLTTEGFSLKKEDYKGNVAEKKIEVKEASPVEGANLVQAEIPAKEAVAEPETITNEGKQPGQENPLSNESKQEKAVKEPAKEVKLPESFTMEEAMALGNLAISGENVSGDGIFSWKEAASVPQAYENIFEVIFTPNDSLHYDYSQIEGWKEDRQVVERSVKVYVNSLKSQEEVEKKSVEEKKEVSENITDEKTTSDIGKKAESEIKSEDKESKEELEVLPDKTAEEKKVEIEEKKDEKGQDEETKNIDEESEVLKESKEELADKAEIEQEKESKDTKKDLPLKEKEVEVPEKIVASFQADSIVNHIESMISALPNQIQSEDDVNRVVSASKAFLSLTKIQQERVSQPAKLYLERLQELAGIYNRSNQGISVVGNLPWYVKLKVTLDDTSKTYEKPNVDTIIAPYEIGLYNLMKDETYHLQGEKVQLTLPAPNAELYNRLVIVHYLENGGIEYITPFVGESTISFMTSSFSPFHIAGSKVLAGGNVVSGSYGNQKNTSVTANISNAAKVANQSNRTDKSNSKKNQSSVTKQSKAKQATTKNSQGLKKNTRSKAVKTADKSPILLYFVLSQIAIFGGAVLVYTKRTKGWEK
ncbi:MAG TPA: hypothetical protein VIR32_08465 [Lachnospiraceae bacterium]